MSSTNISWISLVIISTSISWSVSVPVHSKMSDGEWEYTDDDRTELDLQITDEFRRCSDANEIYAECATRVHNCENSSAECNSVKCVPGCVCARGFVATLSLGINPVKTCTKIENSNENSIEDTAETNLETINKSRQCSDANEIYAECARYVHNCKNSSAECNSFKCIPGCLQCAPGFVVTLSQGINSVKTCTKIEDSHENANEVVAERNLETINRFRQCSGANEIYDECASFVDNCEGSSGECYLLKCVPGCVCALGYIRELSLEDPVWICKRNKLKKEHFYLDKMTDEKLVERNLAIKSYQDKLEKEEEFTKFSSFRYRDDAASSEALTFDLDSTIYSYKNNEDNPTDRQDEDEIYPEFISMILTE